MKTMGYFLVISCHDHTGISHSPPPIGDNIVGISSHIYHKEGRDLAMPGVHWRLVFGGVREHGRFMGGDWARGTEDLF